MQKISFLVVLFIQITFFGASSFAQNFKKIGVSVKPEKNWKNSSTPADETDTKFRLVAEGKTAMMEVYNFGKVSGEQASMKTIEILKDRKHKPEEFEQAKQRKEKIGKIDFVVFENVAKTFMDTQNKTLVQWWSLYMCEIKGKKIVIYTSEFYIEEDKKPTTKADVENMLKTLK